MLARCDGGRQHRVGFLPRDLRPVVSDLERDVALLFEEPDVDSDHLRGRAIQEVNQRRDRHARPGPPPKNGARSRIEVLLISTRTMSGLTSGGSATAARMRQSYIAISARSSQPPAPIARTTAAELTPSARPATNLRMQAGPRGAHRAELSVHEGPRRYHESPLYGRFAMSPRKRPDSDSRGCLPLQATAAGRSGCSSGRRVPRRSIPP